MRSAFFWIVLFSVYIVMCIFIYIYIVLFSGLYYCIFSPYFVRIDRMYFIFLRKSLRSVFCHIILSNRIVTLFCIFFHTAPNFGIFFSSTIKQSHFLGLENYYIYGESRVEKWPHKFQVLKWIRFHSFAAADFCVFTPKWMRCSTFLFKAPEELACVSGR